MIDERYLLLMQQEIDRANSQQEQEDLKRYLAQNDEARKMFEDLQAVGTRLSRMPLVDPPDDLRSRILHSIHPVSSSLFDRTVTALKNLLPLGVTRKPVFVYGFAAFVVIAAVLVAVQLSSDNKINRSHVLGTMAQGEISGPLHADQLLEVRTEDVTGSIQIEHRQNQTIAELTLQSKGTCELTVEFDPQVLQFESFHPLNGESASIKSLSGQLSIAQTGTNTFRLYFNQDGTPRFPLTFRFYAAGNMINEQSERLP